MVRNNAGTKVVARHMVQTNMVRHLLLHDTAGKDLASRNFFFDLTETKCVEKHARTSAETQKTDISWSCWYWGWINSIESKVLYRSQHWNQPN